MPAWINFACPTCHANLQQKTAAEFVCPVDRQTFRQTGGIWRFLPDERNKHYRQFRQEYETVRRAEGRGSRDPAFYRGLPYSHSENQSPDSSKNRPSDWRIRATSYDEFIKHVIVPQEQDQQPLAVLDLGAGNGWLSHQLARRGHRTAAVDVLDNDFDGLGCSTYFDADFSPVQAEFDQLPFPDGSANLIIYNAALHYSADISKSLAEARRILAYDGKIVILDSPVYRDASSGEKMVLEREELFRKHFGFPSNTLASQNFLTYQSLQTMEVQLKIHWQYLTPFYGIMWMLRPIRAWLSGDREPAKFHIIVGQKVKSS